MSYTIIATENVVMRDISFPGSKDIKPFVILERFAPEPETITEIGISGDPILVAGGRGNDMFYPHFPVQIQLKIKDQLGWQKRFDGRNAKDFKLQVLSEIGPGATIEHELFLYLPSSQKQYFEVTPEIEVVATNGIGLLKSAYFRQVPEYIELPVFIQNCFSQLGVPGDIEMYANWQSSDNNSPFPIEYRLLTSYLARFDDPENRTSYFDVLENFCEQFNLQLYHLNNKWIFLERKLRIDAPASVTGVNILTGSEVSLDLQQILQADDVRRKPTADFKRGIIEIKTTVKIYDEEFINADLQESSWKKNTIRGWNQPLDSLLFGTYDNPLEDYATVIVTFIEGEEKFKLLLLRALEIDLEDERVPDGFYRGSISQESGKTMTEDDRADISWRINVQDQGLTTEYLQIKFNTLTGDVYSLEDDYETWTAGASPSAPIQFTSGDAANINESISVFPPAGKIGYLEVELICNPATDTEQTIVLKSFDISFNYAEDRDAAYYYNGRGINSPQKKELTFGCGDVDPLADKFVFEYKNTAEEWKKADWISNSGESASIFELAPYDRMCQNNKEKIEFPTLISRKWIIQDWLKTIVLKQGQGLPDLKAIPIEYKWNMATGQVEIYAGEAFYDTTGVTRLKYYNEQDYQDIDPLTVITDQGDVLQGFIMGADSEDGKGFALVFDDSENEITESSKTIHIDNVEFEIETYTLS